MTFHRRRVRARHAAPRKRPQVAALAVLAILIAVLLAGITTIRAATTVRGNTLSPAGIADPAPNLPDPQSRGMVPLGRISPYLRQAVIATEDRRFHTFSAVDPVGIARAVYVDLSTGTFDQGGSTITEQLMKELFVKPQTRDQKLLPRRLAEVILALQYAQSHTKSQILQNYLNTVYFGNGAYGAEAAAQSYFGVPVNELNLAQAATLAGTIRAPSTLDPLRYPKAALERRAVVLRGMLDQGLITKTQYERALREPLGTYPSAPASSNG